MSKIRNYKALAKSVLRDDLLKIIDKGLEKIDTKLVIQENLSLNGDKLKVRDLEINLKNIKKIYLGGVGKCSLQACQSIIQILGNRIEETIVIDPTCEKSFKEEKFKCYKGHHPFPTEENIVATKDLIRMLEGAEENDLVLLVVSGGGSVILCQPNNFTCLDEVEIIKSLFNKGATIQELNTVRKHLSLARGGFLAKYSYPAKVVSMIFSDVPGNDISYVASGPTVLDKTTVFDAKKVFDRFLLKDDCDFNLDDLIETPKEEKYFEKVSNVVVASNSIALNAMKLEAERIGYNPKICSDCLAGEARRIGESLIKQIEEGKSGEVLLYGGETTVLVNNRKGKGGRNMEVSLSGLRFVESENIIMASIASDGRDNTDYAGAICDMITKNKAKLLGLDPIKYLDENDSLEFFHKTGDYIETGSTGSNVSDFLVAIKSW